MELQKQGYETITIPQVLDFIRAIQLTNKIKKIHLK